MSDDDERDMHYGPVEVRVTAPVPAEHHPIRLGSARSYALTTEPVKVLNEHPRRHRVLLSADGVIRMGQSTGEIRTGYAAEWPSGVPLELTHTDEMYFAADAGTVTLSVVEEYRS